MKKTLMLFIFFVFIFIFVIIYVISLISLSFEVNLSYTSNIESKLLYKDSLSIDKKIKTVKDSHSKKFYIYNWSQNIIDRWPDNYSHHRLSIKKEFNTNNGCGPLVNQSLGRYHTHQYVLFTLFYNRLLESPYRTSDPNEAALFFIPYDFGMDCSTRKNDGALARTNCPMLQSVINLLSNNSNSTSSNFYFNRYDGNDHFLIVSINQMMLYYTHERTFDLYKLCYNCTKLSIDAYPSNMYRVINNNNFFTNKWISIPFPSDYHYSSLVTNPQWLYDDSPDSINLYFSKRKYSVSFMGSTEVTSKLNKELRNVIIDQCKIHQNDCILSILQTHDSLTDTYSHGNPYSFSKICLMPGGDFLTRKAILDSMLSGCIPLTFNRLSAQKQWLWHWESGNHNITAEDCLLYIDRNQMMNDPKKTFQKIIAFSKDKEMIRKKLISISKIGNQMQYNLPLEANKLPKDAVDIVMEKLLSQK